MEIYIKNKKGELKETSVYDVLNHIFSNSGFKMDNGSFDDGSFKWIGIKQETAKPSEVVINIGFADCGDKITDINVYQTPIKKIVDYDRTVKII